MSVLVTIILGLVQGLTEFIPVSSSGHLVIASALLRTNDDVSEAFIFSVLLNFGTLLALVVFYWQRLLRIASGIIRERQFSLVGKLLVATIPAVLVGLLLGNILEKLDTQIVPVALMLLALGIIMIIAGRPNREATDAALERIPLPTFLWVGLMQAVALMPGTSRSGITILTGLKWGLSAERAAELSFMLAIPTIFGAALKVLLSDEGRSYVVVHWQMVLLGNVVSFLSGYIAIRFLINLVNKHGLVPFGWYRIALAAVLILLVSVKIL